MLSYRHLFPIVLFYVIISHLPFLVPLPEVSIVSFLHAIPPLSLCCHSPSYSLAPLFNIYPSTSFPIPFFFPFTPLPLSPTLTYCFLLSSTHIIRLLPHLFPPFISISYSHTLPTVFYSLFIFPFLPLSHFLPLSNCSPQFLSLTLFSFRSSPFSSPFCSPPFLNSVSPSSLRTSPFYTILPLLSCIPSAFISIPVTLSTAGPAVWQAASKLLPVIG